MLHSELLLCVVEPQAHVLQLREDTLEVGALLVGSILRLKRQRHFRL
jgi:hypothetical protein